jgi:hypothetical protein
MNKKKAAHPVKEGGLSIGSRVQGEIPTPTAVVTHAPLGDLRSSLATSVERYYHPINYNLGQAHILLGSKAVPLDNRGIASLSYVRDVV